MNSGEDRTFDYMGVMDWGSEISTGSGFTKTSGSLSSKKLYLRADADPLWCSTTAWGYMGRDFYFNGSSNKSAYVTIEGDYVTSLISVLDPQIFSDASAAVEIKAEIWDTTVSSRLDSRTILDESIGSMDAGGFTDNYSDTFSVMLKPQHSYVAIVYVELTANSRITGSARAYAHPDDNGYVKVNKVKITF